MEPEQHGEVPASQEIEFCTLGMFIIGIWVLAYGVQYSKDGITNYEGTGIVNSEDFLLETDHQKFYTRIIDAVSRNEIHYLPPKAPVFNIIGGAGAFSAVGARICSPPPSSRAIGWVVDMGFDFPPSIQSTIQSWMTSCRFRFDISRLTTRGYNKYDALENRSFRYATPKLRLDQNSLSAPLLMSKSFHLICSPTRCIDLVTSILAKRRQMGTPSPLPRPIFIWEPVPDLCIPDQLLEITRALSHIDICSPNHAELGSLMGCSAHLPDGSADKQFIEDATEQLLGSMPISSFSIVVRCGASGCYIGKNGGGVRKRLPSCLRKRKSKQKRPPVHSRGGLSAETDFADLFARLDAANWDEESPSDEEEDEEEQPDWGIWTWIPAFHTDPRKVVDPTGGGNAFLGGMAVALARGKGLEEAARYGSISASFAIEQVGVPTLRVDQQGNEVWNGVRVPDRLAEFEKRLSGSGRN